MEFPTQEAMKKYLDAHPGADKSIHYVVEHKPHPSSQEEGSSQDSVLTNPEEIRLSILQSEEYKKWQDLPESINSMRLTQNVSTMLLLNDVLKGESDLDKDYQKIAQDRIQELKDNMYKFSLPKSIQVHKVFNSSLSEELLKGVLVGEFQPQDIEWNDKGFVSTRIGPQKTSTNNILCNINLPQGTPGAYISGELWLPPGSKFVMTKVSKQGSQYVVDCNLIMGGEEAKPLPKLKSKPEPKTEPVEEKREEEKDEDYENPQDAYEDPYDYFHSKKQKQWEESVKGNYGVRVLQGYVLGRDLKETIDDYLRTGDFLDIGLDTEDVKDRIEDLQDLISKYRLNRDIVCYQEISTTQFEKGPFQKVLEGTIDPEDVEWTDASFSNLNIYDSGDAHKILCHVTVPKGTSGVYAGNLVGENFEYFVLPPESTFKLKKIRKGKNKWGSDIQILDCEVVPKESKKTKTPEKKKFLEPELETFPDVQYLFSRKKYQDWYKSLSWDKKDAIARYTGNGFQDINKYLRTGKFTPPEKKSKEELKGLLDPEGYSSYEDEFNEGFNSIEGNYTDIYTLTDDIRNLESAISKYRLPQSIRVYRGVGFSGIPKDLFEQVLEGSIKPEDVEWTDKGFGSTSIKKEDAFDKVVFCHIAVPAGNHGIYVEDLTSVKEEHEFLLPPHTTYKLQKVERHKALDKNKKEIEGYKVYCEVIPTED